MREGNAEGVQAVPDIRGPRHDRELAMVTNRFADPCVLLGLEAVDDALRGTLPRPARKKQPHASSSNRRVRSSFPARSSTAPSTDPVWTPLFLAAGGLVPEMAGAHSHGAVVAGEYRIPAVVGVPDATSKITTGQQVHVDDTKGVMVPANDRELARP
jgi:phosphohistidine swiveling domain-containing protein